MFSGPPRHDVMMVTYPENVRIGVVHLPRLRPLGEDIVEVHAVVDGVTVHVAFRLRVVIAPDCAFQTPRHRSDSKRIQ